MTRTLLSILLLPCALVLGCSAEPPPPGTQPAQSETAAGEPQAQPTPIFTDDFEEGKAESWSQGEEKTQPPGDSPTPPAETN